MVELLHVIHILRPVVVGVNHRDVSRLIDALAEGEGIGGRLFAGQAVRARLVGGVFLLVVDNRVIDRIAVDQLEQVVRFLKGLLLAQRLGKQIDADVQARGGRALDVLREQIVRHDAAGLVAAVGGADEHIVDTRGLDRVPVDRALIGGHIDTERSGDVILVTLISKVGAAGLKQGRVDFDIAQAEGIFNDAVLCAVGENSRRCCGDDDEQREQQQGDASGFFVDAALRPARI